MQWGFLATVGVSLKKQQCHDDLFNKSSRKGHKIYPIIVYISPFMALSMDALGTLDI